MSYNKYKIEKGDTLSKIASKFGISPNQLREYHNRYCSLDDLLSGNEKLPKHLKEILLPEGQLTYKEKVEKSLDTHFSLGKEKQYKIEIDNSFFIKKNLMSQNQTESVWEISEENNNAYIKVQDTQIIKYNSQLKDLMDLVKEINKSSDYLVIALNSDGTMGEVINKKEIIDKWEAIKFEKIKQAELQDDFVKILIEQYNQAFEKITPYIRQNMLYQLIFCPKKPYWLSYNQPEILTQGV